MLNYNLYIINSTIILQTIDLDNAPQQYKTRRI